MFRNIENHAVNIFILGFRINPGILRQFHEILAARLLNFLTDGRFVIHHKSEMV